jgi:hypothetical protein
MKQAFWSAKRYLRIQGLPKSTFLMRQELIRGQPVQSGIHNYLRGQGFFAVGHL